MDKNCDDEASNVPPFRTSAIDNSAVVREGPILMQYFARISEESDRERVVVLPRELTSFWQGM
jgi:hypothetical protein